MRNAVIGSLLAAALIASCRKSETPAAATAPEKPAMTASHQQEIEAWQAQRATGLQKEGGWLSLVGLYWLKDGSNSLGSDPTSDVVLPAGKAPLKAGTLALHAGEVTLTAAPGSGLMIHGKPVTSPVKLISDANGALDPTTVTVGSLSFFIINRNDRVGVRVKDKESEARTKFAGLQYFPIDPKWRVTAKFEPYNPPKKVRIVNVLGMESDESSPGALAFTIDGKEYRVEPILETGETDFFLIIKDGTSGKETYPAGRYLYVKPPGPDGVAVIDFNKAYNPPCAFTHFATCPLPPPQNRLPIRIEAGEKKYEGPH
jgi:uncharacterized protein (DUF1684 family)